MADDAGEAARERARQLRRKFQPIVVATLGVALISMAYAQSMGVTPRMDTLRLNGDVMMYRLASNVAGAESETALGFLKQWGGHLRQQGKLAEAEYVYDHVLKIRVARAPGEPETIDAMHALGSVLRDRGNLARAADLLSEALGVAQDRAGERHPLTLKLLHEYAATLLAQGHVDDATGFARDAYARRGEELKDGDADTLASQMLYAQGLQAQGFHAEAAALFEGALNASANAYGARSPIALSAQNNLASCLAAAGETERAERLFRECLESCKTVLGPEHVHTINVEGNYAVARRDAAAIGRVLDALTKPPHSLPPVHPWVVKFGGALRVQETEAWGAKELPAGGTEGLPPAGAAEELPAAGAM